MAAKILLVDDEPQILRLLEIELTTEGYSTFQARNGKEAVEKAKSIKPELILMDILLPDMSGADAIRMIKETPALKNTAVIFLTGLLTKGEEHDAQMITVDEQKYPSIAKPFDAKELLGKIIALLGNQ